MGKHTNPDEVVDDDRDGGMQGMVFELDPEESKAFIRPQLKLALVHITDGDLDAARLAFGWIEIAETVGEQQMRISVYQEMRGDLDAAMAAHDWVWSAVSAQQSGYRLACLHHAADLEAAKAAAQWIED